MSELDPLNPGQVLKNQREKMGLSLNDIAVATKINPKILKALEDGQKEVLPPRSFVRGFIRSYANYLKLKPEPILEAFEMGDSPGGLGPVTDNDPSPAKSSRSDVSRLEKSSRVGTIIVAVGIVVLIVLIFGVKSMMDKYASERVVDKPAAESTKEEAESAAAATTDAPADESTATASGTATTETTDAAGAATTPIAPTSAVTPAPVVDPKAEAAADAKIAADKKAEEEKAATEKQAAADKLAADKKEADKAAADKLAVEKKEAADKAAADRKIAVDKLAAEKKAAAETKAKAAAAAPAVKPEAKAPSKPGVPQEVIIEALDDVQITVAVDGGGSKKITLKPESVYTVKAKSDVTLDVSDGGLVNIIHNGNDRGNPGTLGKAAKVKYP